MLLTFTTKITSVISVLRIHLMTLVYYLNLSLDYIWNCFHYENEIIVPVLNVIK